MTSVNMGGRLAGKVAVVTGGASGIGAAICERFALEGASVIVADLQEAAGEALVDGLRERGGEATFVRADVSAAEDIRHMIEMAPARYGRLDILVNNAGTGSPAAEVDTTEAEWDRILDVNLKAVFLASKYAIPHMKAGGGGSVINISSVFGIVGSPGFAAYHASKGAVRTLTKSTAVTHARDGIRANSIHPGVIDTPLLAAALGATPDPEAARGAFVDRHPIGRLGRAEEVADGCLFLASDESSFMVGSELVIDGGYTAL